MTDHNDTPAVCDHCQGGGEEPGAPFDMELGQPLCLVCKGTGEYTPEEDDDTPAAALKAAGVK